MQMIYPLLVAIVALTTNTDSIKIPSETGICCYAAWTTGPLSTKAAYGDFFNLDLHCDALRCVYRTCGESGYINGIYYNKSLPMEWSTRENKFVHGNIFCGVGLCNFIGCNCEGGCLVPNIKDDPHV